jgi:hypothetical protein
VIVHAVTSGDSTHTKSARAGNVSVSVTCRAVPGPPLDTVIVNPIASPADTDTASGVFTTLMFGHWTATVPVPETGSSLLASAMAVLLIVPQLCAVVGDETCTVRVAPAASVPKSHDSTAAVIVQPGAEPATIDQFNPGLAGSVSVTVTPVAAPGPALVTVIVNPIRSPADTDAASAVFTTLMSGHWTTTVPAFATGLPLLESAVAVLVIVAHDAAVVGDETCTVLDCPGPRSPKLHDSTPAVIEQSATSGDSDHTSPAVAGNVSVKVTPLAVPGPALDTVIENPIAVPADTVP